MRQAVAVIIFSFMLSGFFSIAHARLDISPSSIYFSHTQIGNWDVRTFTVRNTDKEEQRVDINSTCFMDFEVRDNCFGTLRQYQSCSAEVWFRPRYEGYANCNINVYGNTSSQNVSVTGYGYKRW